MAASPPPISKLKFTAYDTKALKMTTEKFSHFSLMLIQPLF